MIIRCNLITVEANYRFSGALQSVAWVAMPVMAPCYTHAMFDLHRTTEHLHDVVCTEHSQQDRHKTNPEL